MTAGHCVHSGVPGGWFQNFLFTPAEGAYGDGTAPYESWDAESVRVSDAWMSGGGTVPNAADYAIIELRDRNSKRIGSVTGWLGYRANSLHPNHAHLLGYPCNHDSCRQMHQVTAESHETVSPNNVIYGSDMRGGSSGGPWVQNFGSNGITVGANSFPNSVIGVPSWISTSTAPLFQGSSILDSTFTDLLDVACAHSPGNC